MLVDHKNPNKIHGSFCVFLPLLPSDGAALLVVDLDEFSEAAGVVVVRRLGVPKSLRRK